MLFHSSYHLKNLIYPLRSWVENFDHSWDLSFVQYCWCLFFIWRTISFFHLLLITYHCFYQINCLKFCHRVQPLNFHFSHLSLSLVQKTFYNLYIYSVFFSPTSSKQQNLLTFQPNSRLIFTFLSKISSISNSTLIFLEFRNF